MFENGDSSQIQANVTIAALIMSLVGNILLGLPQGLKWFLERRRQGKIDEFEQLSKLLKILGDELEKREKSDREKDSEISELKIWRETLSDKTAQARKDLWDVSQSCREIKRFLVERQINHDLLSATLNNTEQKIQEIIECLKQNI